MALLWQRYSNVDAAWNGIFESAAIPAVGWRSCIANFIDGTLGTAVDGGMCTAGGSRYLLWDDNAYYKCDLLWIPAVSFSDGDLGLNVILFCNKLAGNFDVRLVYS